jgi:hypothetical protein
LALAILLATSAWVTLAGAPPLASAAPLMLGQAAPSGSPTVCKVHPAQLIEVTTSGFNLSTGKVNPPTIVNPYVVPRAGLITSWSTNAGAGPGQALKMMVFRPVIGTENAYTVVGHDGPRPLAANVLNTFGVAIPVQAGDVIGLNDGNASAETPNACFFATTAVTDIMGLVETDTPDGVSVTMPPLAIGGRPNVAATLQPRPTVTAIGPSSGWFLGGTPVTIRGTDFETASAVSFGETPASGYSVDSETQITAISPPGSAGATVDVSVVTSAGTSATGAADKFTYTARPAQVSRCVVPKLKGKSLRASRKKLRRVGCRLGKVQGPRGRAVKVKAQTPKAGRVLAPGAKVSITFGTHRHRQAEPRR